MVLESAIIMPAVRACSTPPGPNNTPSTALVSETHIHTTSAPVAASAGEAALRAPSTSLLPLRFQTATSCPALTRLAAIDRPIIPMPRKATRIGVDSSQGILSRLWIITLDCKLDYKYDRHGDGEGKLDGWQGAGQSPATTQSLKNTPIRRTWPAAFRYRVPEHL